MIDDVELLLAQKAILDEGKAIYDATRVRVKGLLKPSERRSGGDYGFASLSKESEVVEVGDREQLHAFLRAEGNVRVVEDITDTTEAIEVLKVYAPHLVRSVERVPGWAETEAIARVKNGENIPGVLVRAGVPVLSVRVSDAGKVLGRKIMSGAVAEVEK